MADLNRMDFNDWLESTKEIFSSLDDQKKNETIQHLLHLCGSEQLSYLVQVYLPNTCQIDFLAALPEELSYKIINYLDVESAFSSRLVCVIFLKLRVNCQFLLRIKNNFKTCNGPI